MKKSHPIAEANRVAIVHSKIQSAKKSADICIKYHMEGDPDGQEVMDMLDKLDAKLSAMIASRISAMHAEAA